MECVFGMVGDGFALVVEDTSALQSIIVQKSSEDKIMVLDSHKLLGATGERGDRVHFTEFIQKNVHLYEYRNGIPLSTTAAANFTRTELAQALRKSPYFVNLIMAGYDKDVGAHMYYIDYIATLHKLEKVALGYCSNFILSIMDKYYRKGMSLEDALGLVDMCIAEIRTRMIAAPPNFVIKIVDKDGARELSWKKTIEDVAANASAAVATEA